MPVLPQQDKGVFIGSAPVLVQAEVSHQEVCQLLVVATPEQALQPPHSVAHFRQKVPLVIPDLVWVNLLRWKSASFLWLPPLNKPAAIHHS